MVFAYDDVSKTVNGFYYAPLQKSTTVGWTAKILNYPGCQDLSDYDSAYSGKTVVPSILLKSVGVLTIQGVQDQVSNVLETKKF